MLMDVQNFLFLPEIHLGTEVWGKPEHVAHREQDLILLQVKLLWYQWWVENRVKLR